VGYFYLREYAHVQIFAGTDIIQRTGITPRVQRYEEKILVYIRILRYMLHATKFENKDEKGLEESYPI